MKVFLKGEKDRRTIKFSYEKKFFFLLKKFIHILQQNKLIINVRKSRRKKLTETCVFMRSRSVSTLLILVYFA